MTYLRRIALLKKITRHLKNCYSVDRDLMSRVTDDEYKEIVHDAADVAADELVDAHGPQGTVPTEDEYVDKVAQHIAVELQRRYHEGK